MIETTLLQDYLNQQKNRKDIEVTSYEESSTGATIEVNYIYSNKDWVHTAYIPVFELIAFVYSFRA